MISISPKREYTLVSIVSKPRSSRCFRARISASAPLFKWRCFFEFVVELTLTSQSVCSGELLYLGLWHLICFLHYRSLCHYIKIIFPVHTAGHVWCLAPNCSTVHNIFYINITVNPCKSFSYVTTDEILVYYWIRHITLCGPCVWNPVKFQFLLNT